MKSYRYLHLDVFTDHLFGGNQLAVFVDGRGLSAGTMQAIAKEMNFSETTFVLPADQSGTDVRMRIFTTEEELPMAGHPTIGATFALARTGIIERDRDRFVFGLNIGPTPVTLTWRKDELSFAWMTQRQPVFGPPLTDAAGAAAALSLPPASVAGTKLPAQIVSTGVPFLFVPLTTRRAVDAAAIDRHALEAFYKSAGVAAAHGVFLFSAERKSDKATAYSRMFAPGAGMVEDPATGGASGALGCYLVEHKVVSPANAARILSLQGVTMGRPSHVHISIGLAKGAVTSVRVGGEAVLAGEGTMYV